MAWMFDVNQTPVSGAHAIVQLATLINANGGSIHGFGAGTGSLVVDHTGALPTPAQLQTVGAWVAIILPGTAGTLAFQRGATNDAWWVSWTLGGLNADGDEDTLDTPVTGGDTQDVHGTVGAPAQLFIADDPAGISRIDCGIENGTGAYYLLGRRKATGECCTLLYMESLTSPAEDLAPYVHFAKYTTVGAWSGDFFWSMTLRGWHCYQLGGQAWLTSFAWMGDYLRDGAQVAPNGGLVNPHSLRDDLVKLRFYRSNGGARYKKGDAQNFCMAVLARGTNTTYSTGGVYDNIIMDAIVLPWPLGVAALI